MNRKMIRLARGVKCGCLGAKGLTPATGAASDDVWPNNADKATEPNPQALLRNIARRVEVDEN
jgi:hypothetical protein